MMVPPSYYEPKMPPKIQAVMAYLSFCHAITAGQASPVVGGDSSGRKLTSGEQRCYDAALSTLTEYFNSDGYGEDDGQPPSGDGNAPDVPKVPVKIA